ncbi:phytoene desaturase family protein [Blastococcus saxobsidens]|uniref:Pyridine nucleotide-disulfide oxidoreductase domain-containing protein 2 n=1 Tax=Blastococcus saxobsidens (strain DD2) TaxID=1146883 RepID=H6RT80_BLASD|nr:NAD(P)/FAD-dependent oxidoreductase [Blastococcus saxobsidens]CCG05580.1 Putative phytoene dehydrogenase-like oxidoreductase [Blastococcus saxobsidens DD2]
MTPARRVLVVGGGHNGLVAACYLARGGADVLVLEQSGRLGGGARTEEVLPGHRFDTHSAAHNIIQATGIVEDLELPAAGLEYREMDPFSVAVFRDGRIVRFFRDVEATVDSIAEADRDEARRYAAWMREAMPVVTAMRGALDGRPSRLPARAFAGLRAVARNGGPLGLAQVLLSPYGKLLEQRFASDLVRAPVSAFAAHASAAPDAPGSATFAMWQAFYHQVGQWHAVGGSQGLIDALAARLAALGGSWRTGAAVARITRRGDRATGVELESGERLPADAVLTALDPGTALLDLLDPPLDGPEADRLGSTTRSNAVQMLVHVATTGLPAYPGARPGDWSGLQSFVDGLESLSDGFAAAGARYLPDDPVPTYAFTPSAIDDTLAPPGRHTVYLACPCAPYRVRGGWAAVAEEFADRMVATVEARAPGFTASITGRAVYTPEQMAADLRWPGAHPMYGDLNLDQLGRFRPTRALARHRTPVRGLVVAGAGTAPVGGIAGASGRSAARVLLRDLG